MKRLLLVSLIVTLSQFSVNASAQDLGGRFGLEAKVGLIQPSDITVQGEENGQNVVPSGALGFLFRFTRNIFGEFETSVCHFGEGAHATTNVNFMLGAQYRFEPVIGKIVPFVGGGASYVIYASDDVDTDGTYSFNFRGGADYFISKRIAIPLEMQLSLGGEAASYYAGRQVGHYEATSFAVMSGIKYYF